VAKAGGGMKQTFSESICVFCLTVVYIGLIL
jgi:hypothetical protein